MLTCKQYNRRFFVKLLHKFAYIYLYFENWHFLLTPKKMMIHFLIQFLIFWWQKYNKI